MNEELETKTRQIYSKRERESLRKLASKITKVPDKIIIPTEYWIDKEEK